jgi:hypothetical protein
MHSFAVLFTNLSKLSTYAREKPFSCGKLAYVDFSSSDFNVQGRILSTSGDALSSNVVQPNKGGTQT